MIVLDTHALLWWQSDPARLGKRALRALRHAPEVGVPAICLWEVAMLEAKGRIKLDRTALQWLTEATQLPAVTVLALTPSVAVQSVRLPSSFRGDPADRLIAATAMCEGAPLVSADERLRRLAGLEVLWD